MGSEVTYDVGNVNATAVNDMHDLAFYSGKAPDTAIFVSGVPASTEKSCRNLENDGFSSK